MIRTWLLLLALALGGTGSLFPASNEVMDKSLSLGEGKAVWYGFSGPQGGKMTIELSASRGIDFFIVSEAGLSALRKVMDKGSGSMNSLKRELRVKSGTLHWTLPDGDDYYVVLDNTAFPDGGANSGTDVWVRLRILQERTAPPAPRIAKIGPPRPGRVLLVGQAQVRWKGFKGRRGRETSPLEVTVHHMTEGKDSPEDEKEVATDLDGYFCLEWPESWTRYKLGEVSGDGWSVKPGVSITTTLGEKARKTKVESLGSWKFAVDAGGTVSTSCRQTSMQAEPSDSGGIQIRMVSDLDLSVFEWARDHFADTAWEKLVDDEITVQKAKHREKQEAKEKQK
ncbi:MAG: hypothetical protein HY814_05265 [Candidatus Riflebacteria bacterium]|nr:hypothetical protein [Candidatus Riflebacteria bacterium]